MSHSVLRNNAARSSGGAIAIVGGAVHLSDRAVLLDNRAESGLAVHFTGGSLDYTLPAPLGKRPITIGSTNLARLQHISRRHAHRGVARPHPMSRCGGPVAVLRASRILGSTLGLREWRCRGGDLRPNRR